MIVVALLLIIIFGEEREKRVRCGKLKNVKVKKWSKIRRPKGEGLQREGIKREGLK